MPCILPLNTTEVVCPRDGNAFETGAISTTILLTIFIPLAAFVVLIAAFKLAFKFFPLKPDAADETLSEDDTDAVRTLSSSSPISRETAVQRLQQLEDVAPAKDFSSWLHRQSVMGCDQDVKSLSKDQEVWSGSLGICVVCLEGFETAHQIRELPCRHVFHKRCIDRWFSGNHSSCPTCRTAFMS